MDATVKLVDLDGCGGTGGKANSKTQVKTEPGAPSASIQTVGEKLTYPGHPPCQEMNATVKLVDLDGCGGTGGKANSKTQVKTEPGAPSASIQT